MFVSEWPEKLILDDGSEVLDNNPYFKSMKEAFLKGEKQTRGWRLVSVNPNS